MGGKGGQVPHLRLSPWEGFSHSLLPPFSMSHRLYSNLCLLAFQEPHSLPFLCTFWGADFRLQELDKKGGGGRGSIHILKYLQHHLLFIQNANLTGHRIFYQTNKNDVIALLLSPMVYL